MALGKLAICMLKVTTKGLTRVNSKLIKVENKLTKLSSVLSNRTSKTVNSNIAKSFDHIIAPELKSIKQMKQFNKSAFGIKVFDVQDVEFGKFLTDGMTNFYNKTGGQFRVPKNVIVCDLPNSNGYMMYEPTKDILAISKKHVEKFREIATGNGETLEQVLHKWGKKKFDGTATSMYEKGLYQELFHELGHKVHSTVCKNYCNLGLDWSKKEFQDIASKVSQYSKNNPEEFVAETFSMLVQGKTLPEDVLQLYKKCGGPIIKSTSGGSSGGHYNILTDFIQQSGYTVVSLADANICAKYSKEFPDITIEEAKVLQRVDSISKAIQSSRIKTKIAIEV